MSLMLNARKGLLAYQIARDLGVRRPTVLVNHAQN